MSEVNEALRFEEAILPHLDAAHNLARWLARNKQDAEDIVQEACLRAFRFFPGFRGGDARSWLLRIVRNTCYTWMRTRRPMQDALEFDETVFPPDAEALDPEKELLQNDRSALVRQALEKLPVKYREVLVLRELEGMSYKEIADITGLPAGTVMSSLSRARESLRDILARTMNRDGAGWSRRGKRVEAGLLRLATGG